MKGAKAHEYEQRGPGERLYKEILNVASGQMTKAEALKIGMYVDIWQRDVTHQVPTQITREVQRQAWTTS